MNLRPQISVDKLQFDPFLWIFRHLPKQKNWILTREMVFLGIDTFLARWFLLVTQPRFDNKQSDVLSLVIFDMWRSICRVVIFFIFDKK